MKYDYVLIYNGNGAFPACYDDLRELLLEVYQSPNIVYSDFNSQLDGLTPENTTLAIPGGSLVEMGLSLCNQREKLQQFFNSGGKGVFICSGAYLAASNADIFHNRYLRADDGNTIKPLEYFGCTQHYGKNMALNLNIIQNFKAYGPFVPNDCWNTYSPEKLKIRGYGKPCATRIKLQSVDSPVNQLYWGGCGLEPVPNAITNQPCEVIATYHDKKRHSFFYPAKNQTKTIDNMAAIVGRKGLVASGVHIETCVQDSKLLEAASKGEGHALPLPNRNDHDQDLALARETLIPMLRHYLTG